MNNPNRASVPDHLLTRAPRIRFLLRYAFTLASLVTCCILFCAARAQNRDHLTDAESELIRENQQLDKRIEVFIRAIDRRFAIVTGVTQPEPKRKEKDKNQEDWGEQPIGTHAQLLEDVAGILD